MLLEIIQTSGILQHEKKILKDSNLVLLLVHDLLLSKGGIQAADGPIKQAVLKHKTRLSAELVKVKVKRGVTKVEDLAVSTAGSSGNGRRWVRLNTLKSSQEDILRALEKEGFTYVDGEHDLSGKAFILDRHIPNLVAIAPSVRIQESTLFNEGKLIIQDKASCFPAFVLDPPSNPNTHVIDATAAPGNKTSHLSALMQGRGRITAFERDRKRFQTLKTMLERAGASNVMPKNQDFLSVDPNDVEYANVTHILLDPSCSGSGIVNRLDHLVQTENEGDSETDKRLEKLASFQLTMIRHAMKFPSLRRLVYSTCSIHAKENEEVVIQALECDEAIQGGFLLEDRSKVIPAWPRRGMLPEGIATAFDPGSVIRCSPEDGTNGFFVSCFIRDGTASAPSKRKAEAMSEGSEDEGPKEPVAAKKKRKKRKV